MTINSKTLYNTFIKYSFITYVLQLLLEGHSIETTNKNSTNDLKHMKLDYSLKNIPIAFKLTYKQKLYQKLYKFIQNLRWKAYWYSRHNDCILNNNNTYFGFPARNSAPERSQIF